MTEEDPAKRIYPRRTKNRIKPVKVDSKDVVKSRTEDGKIVWMQKGISLDQLPHKVWPYSERTSQIFVQMICEGLSMTDACKIEGMPPLTTLTHWLTTNQEFKKRYREAKTMRAELRADMAMQIAADSKDYKIHEDRLKFDALKWGASVDNPDDYGNRTKLTGDATQPLALYVSTGVPHGDDDTPVKVELDHKDPGNDDNQKK